MTMPQGGQIEQAMSDLSQNVPAMEDGRQPLSNGLIHLRVKFP